METNLPPVRQWPIQAQINAAVAIVQQRPQICDLIEHEVEGNPNHEGYFHWLRRNGTPNDFYSFFETIMPRCVIEEIDAAINNLSQQINEQQAN